MLSFPRYPARPKGWRPLPAVASAQADAPVPQPSPAASCGASAPQPSVRAARRRPNSQAGTPAVPGGRARMRPNASDASAHGASRSAGFQTCCIADFQIGRAAEFRARAADRGVAGGRAARGFGNPRHSRLGSLRYLGWCADSPRLAGARLPALRSLRGDAIGCA